MEFSEMLHDILYYWLKNNLVPIKSINHKYDTSHIRAAFFQAHGNTTKVYVDNIFVNKVMKELGFHAGNLEGDPYLHYNISSRSPAIQIYKNDVLTR